jgi:prepilin-type N-terminal cleavage/methylation domain-containing protein
MRSISVLNPKTTHAAHTMTFFHSTSAFTLMELLITTILIGIVAAFALPQYGKSIRKAHERDAIVQLQAIHAAQLIYHSSANEFLPTGAGNLNEINAGLNLNILPNEMVYSYSRTASDAYTASAFWDESGNANDFRVTVSEAPLSANNPCCHATTAGQCPTRPNC